MSRSSITESILSPFETASPLELGVPDGAFTFGFAGRLEMRKGLVDLAMRGRLLLSALPEAWLVIAGKGPDEQRAREILATRRG